MDTRVERTLAQAGMVVTKSLLDTQQHLCGVTGHSLLLEGPAEACISIRDVQGWLPVYITNMKELCLLGLNYLEQRKACVNLDRNSLRVHGEEVPLLPEDGCIEVVATELVQLAPRTEAQVKCKLMRVMHKVDSMVEPTKD